jgi:hypothetical protein
MNVFTRRPEKIDLIKELERLMFFRRVPRGNFAPNWSELPPKNIQTSIPRRG